MVGMHIDPISRLFGERRSSRQARRGPGRSATQGTPTATLPVATPVLDTSTTSPEFLFVQSFGSGTIAPSDNTDGRFTVTLQHGLGQTIYFSDRPERIVGATPTSDFLGNIGFLEDNPPNAALVIDDGADGTNIAVVELFAPLIDPVSPAVIYDVAVLEDYGNTVGAGFMEAPADLSAIPTAFGSSHLFIDDCPDGEITCVLRDSQGYSFAKGSLGVVGHCWYWGEGACLTCGSGGYYGALNYWATQCNNAFGSCSGKCVANGVCNAGYCGRPSNYLGGSGN